MSNANYSRLPLHALSDSGPRRRSSTDSLESSASPEHSYYLPRRRRWFTSLYDFYRLRNIVNLLKIAVAGVVLLFLTGYALWEPHIELAFYWRGWLKEEIDPVPPLASCFRPENISPQYNLSEAVYGRRKNEVHAGVPLRMGLDCYNFAGTILPEAHDGTVLPPDERTQYHTYWRTDLAAFGERQEWMLKSFFATQNTDTSRLILWSNGDLSGNEILQMWLRRFPDAFALRIVDYSQLARGTVLYGSELLRMKDTRAWIDGDLVRLLVLWAYGGVWVDMDSLLTRDLSPLLEHEFVTQWDCYDKIYLPFNGALMRFREHSPYLCEAFNIMVTSKPPRQGSTDWGALLYFKLWRRLTAESVPPFKVLPWCFTDARSCRLDNRLPDPFEADPADGHWTLGLGREEDGGLDVALGKVFSLHLHNQWEKPYPAEGWVARLLLRRYDAKLSGSVDTREMKEL